MKFLILETSTESALLAVVENGQILQEKHMAGGPQLSKSLGLEIKQFSAPFDAIILGTGPGSYTGIRVGSSMAQALSFGWTIPLYTVSSLTGFAPTEENFIIAIDARSGGLFIQENFTTPKLLKLEEAEPLLKSYPIIASPHPEKLLQRLPTLTNLVQTRPNPLLLAQFAIATPKPNLSYFS